MEALFLICPSSDAINLTIHSVQFEMSINLIWNHSIIIKIAIHEGLLQNFLLKQTDIKNYRGYSTMPTLSTGWQ